MYMGHVSTKTNQHVKYQSSVIKSAYYNERQSCLHVVVFTNNPFDLDLLPSWLAVHGKPVLFWNGTSGLKFPCFLFMHANGTGPFEFRAVPIL